ncbi:MAG: hypothetical protein ACRES9_04865 [Gammaproteobacteria bacterium]
MLSIGLKNRFHELPPRYADDGPIDYRPRVESPDAETKFPPKQTPETEALLRLPAVERERDALAVRLRKLEQMLADPERAQNAILYFQLRAIWDRCRQDLSAMAERFREKHAARTESDPSSGMPLERRRVINALLIAQAQEYYLDYREEQVAEMARLAHQKPIEAVNFGFSDECLRLGSIAREVGIRAGAEENHGDRLRRRAKELNQRLRFAQGESVPLKESLHSMPARVVEGELPLTDYAEIVPVNVLALDYWNLSEALLP